MDDYEQLLHSLVVERFRVSSALEPSSANEPPRARNPNQSTAARPSRANVTARVQHDLKDPAPRRSR